MATPSIPGYIPPVSKSVLGTTAAPLIEQPRILVVKPILPIICDVHTSGTSTVTLFTSEAPRSLLFGSGVSISVTHDATGAYANSAYIIIQFHGDCFGLAFDPIWGATQFPIGCRIDGVPYAVNNSPHASPIDGTLSTRASELGYVMVANDLPDTADTNKLHFVELNFACDTVTDRTDFLTGIVVNRSAGYTEEPPFVEPLVVTLTSTPTSLSGLASSSPQNPPVVTGQFKGVKAFDFYNSTGAAITVTATLGSSVLFTGSVPANSTLAGKDFGGISTGAKSILFSASATGAFLNLYGMR